VSTIEELLGRKIRASSLENLLSAVLLMADRVAGAGVMLWRFIDGGDERLP
jgi:hypothetical protein